MLIRILILAILLLTSSISVAASSLGDFVRYTNGEVMTGKNLYSAGFNCDRLKNSRLPTAKEIAAFATRDGLILLEESDFLSCKMDPTYPVSCKTENFNEKDFKEINVFNNKDGKREVFYINNFNYHAPIGEEGALWIWSYSNTKKDPYGAIAFSGKFGIFQRVSPRPAYNNLAFRCIEE